MRKKTLFLVVAFEFATICYLIFLFTIIQNKKTVISPPSLPKKINPALEKIKWKKYMQHVGIQKAYSDFISTYKNEPIYFNRHLSLHYMGELLYETSAMDGLQICDSSFSYACYHGFFGIAIQTVGISNIKELDKICLTKTDVNHSSCSHGIGHGVLSYFGNEKIVKALETCDRLKLKKHQEGCYDGVFMEYNISSHDGKLVIRQIENSPYSSCLMVPAKYQNRCFYFLPFWWEYIFQHDYKKIAELCSKLKNPNKESCYLGIGNISIQASNFDVDKTKEKCDQILDIEGNAVCKAGATLRYNVQIDQIDLDIKAINILCDSLSSSGRYICIEKSKIRN